MTASVDAWDRVFGAAVGLAVAADGAWEDAVRLPLDADSEDDIGRRLSKAGPDSAIEVVFDTGAFVGVRLRPAERADTVGVVAALRDGLGRVAADGPVTASAAIGGIDRAVATRFHHVRPDHAELGVLDRWRSLGHLRMELPVPADPPIGTPGVPVAAPGPIILETVFGPDSGGWLGAPVSAPSSGLGHDIDPARWREVALLPTDLCVQGDCRNHP